MDLDWVQFYRGKDQLFSYYIKFKEKISFQCQAVMFVCFSFLCNRVVSCCGLVGARSCSAVFDKIYKEIVMTPNCPTLLSENSSVTQLYDMYLLKG